MDREDKIRLTALSLLMCALVIWMVVSNGVLSTVTHLGLIFGVIIGINILQAVLERVLGRFIK